MNITAKVVEVDGKEVVIIETTEKNEEVEFRIYYDDLGNVLFYTCEKPEGNYLIIDKLTYAEMRYDLKVVNGKLKRIVPGIIISKLKPSVEDGINCSKEDVSIVVSDNYINLKKWKKTSYEIQ